MDRRRNPRVEVHLPVQVWGIDAYGQAFTIPALVTDMSACGLVLQRIQRRVRVGDLLDIRMGDDQAQFRIIWIGAPNSKGCGQIGLQRVTERAFIPGSVLAYCSQSAAAC
jgi:hypothetical protein